ncbi:MAG: Uma2 family endonuclease [Candidatus Sumerlaeaceae bacterium]
MSISPSLDQVISGRRRRFTVAEYERAWQSGVFGRDERTELIEGEIIHVTPMGSRHASVILSLVHALYERTRKYFIGSQLPVALGTRNEPEPDVLVLKPAADKYKTRKPLAADILLLVEVCDSSMELDRQVKLPMYARNGVPEVWLIDCAANQVHVYRMPEKGNYTKALTVGLEGEIKLSQARGVSVKVSEFLSPP